jgi:hypothetical protein
LEIDRYLDSERLKVSRLVCRQWLRVATPLLFQRAVLYRPESSQCFKEILGRAHLSRLVEVISFESTYDGELGELNLIPLTTSRLPHPPGIQYRKFFRNVISGFKRKRAVVDDGSDAGRSRTRVSIMSDFNNNTKAQVREQYNWHCGASPADVCHVIGRDNTVRIHWQNSSA